MGRRISDEEVAQLYQTGKFTDEDLEQILIANNPARWCEAYLRHPDHPEQSLRFRSYQKIMVNGLAKNKIARCGRRVGKSVSLCSEAIWNAVTEADYRVVIIAPMKENIKELERVISNMALSSPLVKKSIVEHKREPLYIKFNNNSEIVCLPANRNPSQIRGKGCNALYLDEADYLNEEALSAVLHLLQTKTECNVCGNESLAFGCNHEAGKTYTLSNGKRLKCDPKPMSTLWCSSTPTGARSWFYEQCKNADKSIRDKGRDNLEYAHYHYPSTMNPQWGPEMEAQMRNMITDEHQWNHEVMADFGESAHAVYKGALINKALDAGIVHTVLSDGSVREDAYTFTDYHREGAVEKGRYIFGIDWNGPKHGTQIVVVKVEADTSKDKDEVKYTTTRVNLKLRVINRYSINQLEHTIEKTVNMIIKLNTLYTPSLIVVDGGYGVGQIEQLKKYAMNNPTSGLNESIMVVNFGDMLTVPDPFGGPELKKSTKDFMIDNTRWLFEGGAIILPKEEEDCKDCLVYQLRNMNIERYTTNAKPVYATMIDHAHDAFILAMYGFRKKMTSADEPIMNSDVSIPMINPLIAKNPLSRNLDNADFNRDISINENTMDEFLDLEKSIMLGIPIRNSQSEHSTSSNDGIITRGTIQELVGSEIGEQFTRATSYRNKKPRPGCRRFW